MYSRISGDDIVPLSGVLGATSRTRGIGVKPCAGIESGAEAFVSDTSLSEGNPAVRTWTVVPTLGNRMAETGMIRRVAIPTTATAGRLLIARRFLS